MNVNEQAIAACLGITKKKAYHAILPSFVMGEWSQYRPGMLLYSALIEEFSAKTESGGYFDFTVGDEVYKKRLGGQAYPLYEWMKPYTVKGWKAYLIWQAKRFLRQHPDLRDKVIKAREFIKQRQEKAPVSQGQVPASEGRSGYTE